MAWEKLLPLLKQAWAYKQLPPEALPEIEGFANAIRAQKHAAWSRPLEDIVEEYTAARYLEQVSKAHVDLPGILEQEMTGLGVQMPARSAMPLGFKGVTRRMETGDVPLTEWLGQQTAASAQRMKAEMPAAIQEIVEQTPIQPVGEVERQALEEDQRAPGALSAEDAWKKYRQHH